MNPLKRLRGIVAADIAHSRADGSVPDPAPHACHACGTTNGLGLVLCVTTGDWYCDRFDLEACNQRRTSGAE